MIPLVIGILLGALKLLEIGIFANMSWWWVGGCFFAAALWWHIADSTGMTQRRAVQKMDERKAKRRERDMEALGLNTRRAKRLQAIKDGRRRAMSPEQRDDIAPDRHETGRKS